MQAVADQDGRNAWHQSAAADSGDHLGCGFDLPDRGSLQRLKDKTGIVTGAGEGIGRATAQLFAEEGAAVGILDVNPDLAEAAAQDIASATGASTAYAVADVSDEDAVRTGVSMLARQLGNPTLLVNNAAASGFRGMKRLEASPEDWLAVLSVNVIGLALVAKHVVPLMQRAGSGAIVNIASISGCIAQRGSVTYSASKGSVLSMTRCMALDLAGSGVRVNSVSPGAVWSAAVQRLAAEHGWSREEAAQQPGLGLETIMKRNADPREIAYAILFLASDEASYITGANLMVDGGWSAI